VVGDPEEIQVRVGYTTAAKSLTENEFLGLDVV